MACLNSDFTCATLLSIFQMKEVRSHEQGSKQPLNKNACASCSRDVLTRFYIVSKTQVHA